jgi:putative nucleotidyltransferase with HDIG domain
MSKERLEITAPVEKNFFDPGPGAEIREKLSQSNMEVYSKIFLDMDRNLKPDGAEYENRTHGRSARINDLLIKNERARRKKILATEKILMEIKRNHDSELSQSSVFTEEQIWQKHAFVNANLLYLVAATDGYDDYVGHSFLVAKYTRMLTKALGIKDGEFLMDIERGALLHDIGKIGIPEAILRKKSPLTEIEYEVVKEHPVLGFQIIKKCDFLKNASGVVLYHHERYDGKGYPYGLTADGIPLEARIFSIADTLDAITSDRTYRKGKSFRDAQNEILKDSGTQFDPDIVDAFLTVSEEQWLALRSRTMTSFFKPETVH